MVEVEVQFAVDDHSIPGELQFQQWASVIDAKNDGKDEVSMRIVGVDEMTGLNSQFREKSEPTNVLSFPAALHAEVDLPFIGDVIICAPIVAKEAMEQGKTCDSHWAHMTVHGILHLQGYDHLNDNEAAEMETLEIEILNKLGYANPYT